MLRFLLGRLAVLIPTFIGVSIIAFSFIRLLPGDPVALLSGERVMDRPSATPRSRTSLASTGRSSSSISIISGASCTAISAPRSRPSSRSSTSSSSCSRRRWSCRSAPSFSPWCSAFRPAFFAAIKRGSWFDQAIMGTALIGFSMPIFWWGLLLIILFSGMLQWTPVSGRISLMYLLPAGHRLHAGRLADLRPGRRLQIGGEPSHPADHRARHHSAGRHRAPDAFGHAGSAVGGLCAHRPRQGPVGVPRRRRPCAAQRDDPGRHHDRPAGRRHAGRRDPDGDDLLLAGHRQMDGRFGLQARLSGHPGRAA